MFCACCVLVFRLYICQLKYLCIYGIHTFYKLFFQMANTKTLEDLAEVLEKLPKIHYSTGRLQQSIERVKAGLCLKTNELQAIYHLVESHSPSLRLKAILRYEKFLNSEQQKSLSKNYVASDCRHRNENVEKMLEKVKEMPAEWTLVQFTPFSNSKENVEIDVRKHYTNSLYLTVFNCGESQAKPFCVEMKAPRDTSLKEEIHLMMEENRNTLSLAKGQQHFKGVCEKKKYYEKRAEFDDRLKLLVKSLQDLYLSGWRCLLIGKYVNSSLEMKVQKRIRELLTVAAPSIVLDEKTMSILQYLTKSVNYLKLSEVKMVIQSAISSTDQNMVKVVAQLVRNISNEYKLAQQKTYPLILILDDSLDCFPWEMMDILSDKSVSRLPSLHLAYALYQEHKESIRNGFKLINNPHNGKYIINPDVDLPAMQNRILSFYNYCLPKWTGLAGCKPTEEQFEKLVTDCEIFAYNGHGSGSHLFPAAKIEQFRINAVVLLFGCSSTKLNILGPQIELVSPYHMYLIACSPCIVGNLWAVTDLDTDVLATELLSQWIPYSNQTPWKNLDKSQWKRGELVNFSSDAATSSTTSTNEPELLKVLSACKKSNLLTFYFTKAGIVARGIPVKICT